jgi:hypothetical protein
MSFLRRIIGGSGERSPEWASFMPAAAYRQFEAEVIADLTARGYAVRMTGDGGVEASGGPNPGIYGLFNLAQVCNTLDPSAWPATINRHFSQLAAIKPAADDPFDLETARPLLRIRVYRRSDMPPEALGHMIKRDLAPDLVAALAIDLPTTVRTANKDDVEHWGVQVDELFAIGATNLADEAETYERTTLPMPDGQRIEVMLGDTFFVSSQIVRFVEIVGELRYGALVALPNRHQLAWHVVSNAAGTVQAVQALIRIAGEGYRQGPGSLTPDLYWWRDGSLTLLPSSVDRKGVNFMPPDEFTSVLNCLA